MTDKWKSKTLWANIIAAIALFLSAQYGIQLSGEMVGIIMGGINIILRAITKEPIEW